MQTNEIVIDWLEMMDRQGLAMPLSEMEQLLESTPQAACSTEEYHYLRGLHDGRFLNEELRRLPHRQRIGDGWCRKQTT